LSGSFADFISRYYLQQGKQLQINNAEVMTDGKNGVIQIAGRADYFSVPNLPVRAVFSLDARGNAHAIITYTLRDRSGSMSAWKFSTSFPDIPPHLDTLTLLEAYLVVASHAHTDATTQAGLEAGLSFVGQMSPTGLIGVLDGVVGGMPTLPLYGSIRVPVDETDMPVPSLAKNLGTTRTYPWEVEAALPGISLQAPLGVAFSLGKLKLQDTKYRIFSPLSSEWQAVDEVFDPLTALTGTLDIPSAGLSVEVIGTTQTLVQDKARRAEASAFIEARCKGFSIGNLAQLADLTGAHELSSDLPDSLTSTLKALNKLSLQDLAFSLSAGTQGLYLSWASMTIGVPGCRWRIWGDHVEATDIGLRFNVVNPLGIGGRPSFSADVFGTAEIEGVPVEVKATKNSSGFFLAGKLKNQETLPLKQLMKTYLPSVPPPSDLTVDDLRVSIDPAGLQLSGALAQRPASWKLALGPGKLEISELLFDFLVPGSGPVQGMFRGNIGFGKDVKLAMAYAIPGSFVIRATTDKLSLSQLRTTLTNQELQLPAGFDLTLPSSDILIEEQNGSLRFQLATRVDGLGTFAFEAQNVGAGTWGFAAGMDLGAARASALPGLGALAAVEKLVNLEKLTLIVASYDNAKFQFPDVAKFQNPVLNTGNVALPSQAGGLRAGLNLFAQWRIDTRDKTQNLLAKFLGLDGGTLGTTLQVGTDKIRLFVRRDAKILGQPMSCEFGLMTSYGTTTTPTPSWFLAGSMKLDIQGQPQTFDTTMAFVPTGAFVSGTLKGSAPVDLKVFKLSNLALAIGINWGGLPSLGIAATLDVKKFQSSVAVFFDSTNPSKSLVAGSVSALSLKDVADTLLGGLVPSSVDNVLKTVNVKGTHQFKLPGDLTDELDNRDIAKISEAFASSGKVRLPGSSEQVLLCTNKPGAVWHLTDLTKMRHYSLVKRGNDIEVSVEAQFYFAPQRTMIGSIPFPQGYYLNGAVEFFGFRAAATIDIAANKGISVQGQMDKIVILDEKVFSISALQGGGGPKLSMSTFQQPDNAVEQLRNPHVYVNGTLTMLGVKQGLYASLTEQGIDFELVGQLVPGVHFDLDARFGMSGIGANGRVKVGVGSVDLGALGKVKVNTQLEVEVDIDISNPARSVSVGTGKSWRGGETLLSNELATLVFQSDGNLVLYKTTGTSWEPLWASNTAGRGGSSVSFQSDGNLVIYTPNGPIWATNTNGQGVTKLQLEGNGNFALHDGAGNTKWTTVVDAGGASIELESSFDFAGQHVNLGKFKVDVKPDVFTKLPDIMAKKVEEALREVFKDSTRWANAVKDGIVDGVNDTSKVFRDVYGKSAKEAADLANSMNKGVNQATKAVENVAKDVGKTAQKTTKKAIKKVKFW
jgi:hypothetical protein